ncbi:unnamed protein product [Rhodiola kirilowii]
MEALFNFTPTTHHHHLHRRLPRHQLTSPFQEIKSKSVSSISCTLVNPSVKHLLRRNNGAILLPKKEEKGHDGNIVIVPLSPPPSDSPQEAEEEPPMIVSPESLKYESGSLGAVPKEKMKIMGVHSAMGYLTRILSSKVYDVAVESPLEYAPKLSERVGSNIWIKREDLQPVFSFKLRGAYNMMANLPIDQLTKGVICSSAGNHAQGVALSAQRLGCHAIIVMPVSTPEIKWKAVERLGGEVVLVGESYDEAQAYAKRRAKDENLTFVPPFDHPDVIAGQGTIGMEIMRQMQTSITAIFVPVGGGGLIAGIAAYVKRVRPEVKIIGVEPYDANAMALSLHHGKRIVLDKVGGFAGGVAVKAVGEEPFNLCKELIDGVVLVNRDSICGSIKDMFEEKRSILEPAGALALAGAEAYCKYYGLKGKNVVAIASGANMNFDNLRLVSQLADVGRKREAVLATFIPESHGSVKRLREMIYPVNITELKYRYDASRKEALVLYSVGFQQPQELNDMMDRMKHIQLRTLDLTKNELVKEHLQHLVGGRSDVVDELLCRFIIPERPGSFAKFIDTFSPRWNISLLHYRAQGDSGANLLVGFQVSASDLDDFRAMADGLGYDYVFEMNNEALQLLLH